MTYWDFWKGQGLNHLDSFFFHHCFQTSEFYHSVYIDTDYIHSCVWGNAISRWWLQTFFIFTPTSRNDPSWQIFFNWVETTNQLKNSGWSKFNFNMWKLFASGPFPCWKAELLRGWNRESIEKSMGRRTIGSGVLFFQVQRALFDGLFIDILYKYTLRETNSSNLKTDGWNASFLLGLGFFAGVKLVFFWEVLPDFESISSIFATVWRIWTWLGALPTKTPFPKNPENPETPLLYRFKPLPLEGPRILGV